MDAIVACVFCVLCCVSVLCFVFRICVCILLCQTSTDYPYSTYGYCFFLHLPACVGATGVPRAEHCLRFRNDYPHRRCSVQHHLHGHPKEPDHHSRASRWTHLLQRYDSRHSSGWTAPDDVHHCRQKQLRNLHAGKSIQFVVLISSYRQSHLHLLRIQHADCVLQHCDCPHSLRRQHGLHLLQHLARPPREPLSQHHFRRHLGNLHRRGGFHDLPSHRNEHHGLHLHRLHAELQG